MRDAAKPKRPPGRPALPPDQVRGNTPVCTIRLEPQDAATLRALHRSGKLVPYLRRAAKAASE